MANSSSEFHFPIHPMAELLPMLEGAEFAALVADIKEHGLKEPLALTPDGLLLDGRNRYRACLEAGVEPETVVFAGDPLAFVVSKNIVRRHLNESQRAMFAAKLAQWKLGDNQYTKQGAQICAPTQPDAAAMLNVSRRSVQSAAAVRREAPPELVEAVERGEATLGQVERELKERTAHVSHNTGFFEWYTPAQYVDMAREVMGGIDLDPASSETANEVIDAAEFYSETDDGLKHEWTGRVWMNPPFSQPVIGEFCSKLAKSFTEGAVTEACVLVNNATETTWFQQLASVASAVHFPRGRIHFWSPCKTSSSPLQGQAVLYLGKDPERFAHVFRALGEVWVRWMRE